MQREERRDRAARGQLAFAEALITVYAQKPRRNVWALSHFCYCWRIRHAAADATINLAKGGVWWSPLASPLATRQPAGSSVPWRSTVMQLRLL